MPNFLYPSFEGIYKSDKPSSRLLEKLATRISSGGLIPKVAKGQNQHELLDKILSRIESSKLFQKIAKSRNQYEIVEMTDQSLRFKSNSLLAGANIGLNDVSLRIDNSNGEVHYRVSYLTWAGYGIFLGIVIGIFFILGEFIFPADWYPPEPIKKYIFYPFVGFWCLIWPWILIPMHKEPARNLLIKIMDEVNQAKE
jgi:tetrahydromethanopterin S-methyltransferase subunit G